MRRVAYFSLIILPTLVASNASSLADDQRLEAALKRIELLEGKLDKLTTLGSKIERYAVIEQENRQLRDRLAKLEKEKESNKTQVRQKRKIDQPKTIFENYNTERQYSEKKGAATNWNGIYAGINAGYGKGSYSQKNIEFSNLYLSANDSASIIEGPFAGGQIGLNYQFTNNLVLGFESDVDYSDVRDTQSGYANTFNFGIINSGSYTNFGFTNGRTGLDWLGTARVRTGYSIGNFMPYLTAGLAYGGVSSAANNISGFILNQPNPPGIGQRSSDMQRITLGWSAGAGVEFMFSDQWSVKAEYLYSSIGGISSIYPVTSPIFVNNSYLSEGINTVTLGSFDVHQARFGLNYHIGWLASEPLSLR